MIKRKSVIILALFFVFIFALRFIHLGADPPPTLSTSMGYFGDPGGYANNARNKIVYDRWEMDEWNSMYLNPLTHYMTYAVFLVFGPGVAPMNAVPVIFSCLLLVFLFLVLKKTLNLNFALLGVFLLGVNYIFTMFSRIGVRAVEMVFFVVLALYFLAAGKEPKKSWVFLAGISCFLAFTVKGTFLLILPSVILGLACFSFFQNQKKIEKTLPPLFFFGLGMTVVFFVWLFLFYLPHREMFLSFGTENIKWLVPQHLQEALKNFWERPFFYFMNMPVMTSLASFWLLVLSFRLLTSPKRISLLEWTTTLWFVSNMVYFSIIYYRPARHFIPLIVPIAILCIHLLYGLYQAERIRKPRKVPPLFLPFLFVWILFPVSGFFILHRRPGTAEMESRFLQTAGISLALTLIIFFILKFWPRSLDISLPRHVRTVIVCVLVLASAAFNMNSYLKWTLSPRYDVRTISRDFGLAFEKMNLAGLIAPVISLENRHRAHPYYTDYINRGPDFLEKYNITHIFTSTYAVEKIYYEQDFPEAMKNARLLARYPLWRTYLELFELDPPPDPDTPGKQFYEGEIFFGENGIPRFDPEASGRFAYLAEKSKRGSLLELPGLEFQPGDYRISFFLRVENEIDENKPVARVDVVEARRKRVITYQVLDGGDFKPGDSYRAFPLLFTLKRQAPLIIRVYSTGKTALWFDKAVIERLS